MLEVTTHPNGLLVQVGHVHAGYGKMLLEKSEQLKDLSSIMALHNDYSTAEPFIDGIISCDIKNFLTNTKVNMISEYRKSVTSTEFTKEPD